ncbi:MAG: lipopolysaccharide assembly protein LapA domain-containing protein [Pseudomonadota bacterium]
MLRFLLLLVAFLIGLVLIAFVVANMHPVLLSLDPIRGVEDPAIGYTLPLAIIVSLTFVAGTLFGWLIGWIGQGSWRAEARHQRRRARMEEREKERLRARLGGEEASDYGTRIGLPAPQ